VEGGVSQAAAPAREGQVGCCEWAPEVHLLEPCQVGVGAAAHFMLGVDTAAESDQLPAHAMEAAATRDGREANAVHDAPTNFTCPGAAANIYNVTARIR